MPSVRLRNKKVNELKPVDYSKIIKRGSDLLPHWELNEGTYFVTFRLADSLPQSALDAYKFERQNIVRTAKQMDRQLTQQE